MRAPSFFALCMVATSCATPGGLRPARPAPVVAHAAPAVARPVAPPAAVPERWGEVYARDCYGSITPPVVSPSAQRFVFCDGEFDAASGRFTGSARLGVMALFDDGRALRNDYSDSGIVLGPAARDDTGSEQSPPEGGDPAAVAVSPDGSRVASLESFHGLGAVVVRALPSLALIARVPADRVEDGDEVAYIDDGDPVAVVDGGCVTTRCGKDCTKTTCATRDAYRVAAGGLVPLGGPFAGAVAMHVATSRRRAVVQLPDGQRRLVQLPGGKLVARLPDAPADDAAAPFALDALGERVAWVDAGLHVARLERDKLVEVHRDAAYSPASLVFASDGSLFAATADRMRVLRAGAAAPALPAARYPGAPAGYRSAAIRGHEQTFGDFESSSEPVPPGQVARFRSDDGEADVWVIAEDPREFGDGDIEDWQRAVLERYGVDPAKDKHVDAWSDLGDRSLEYTQFVRDGCEPVDRYVRVTGHGGLVYRVVVEFPPGTPAGNVRPVLERFFDVLGAYPGARRLARAPAPPQSPC